MSLSKQLYIIISIIFFMIFTGNFIISVKNTKSYLQEESITKAQDTATALGMSLKNLIVDKKNPEIESIINAISNSGFYKEIRLENASFTISREELIKASNNLNKSLDWKIQNLKVNSKFGKIEKNTSDDEISKELMEIEGEIQNIIKNDLSNEFYTFIPSKEYKSGGEIKFNFTAVNDTEQIRTSVNLNLSKVLLKVSRSVKFKSVPKWFIHLIPINLEEKFSEISDGWRTTAIIFVSANPGEAYAKLYEQAKSSIIYSILAFIISIIILFFFVQYLLKPLKKLEKLANNISLGKFEKINKLPWTSELKSVSLAFNDMSSKIELIINKLNNNLENITKKLSKDELTGLSLKQDFETEMKNMFINKSNGYIFSIKIFELGKFAKSHTNQEVNQFIKKYAQILKNISIKNNLSGKAFRFFGSEFAYIGNDFSQDDVKEFIKEVQKQFEKLSFEYNKKDIAHIGATPFNLYGTTNEILQSANEAYEKATLIGQNEAFINNTSMTSRNMEDWRDLVSDVIEHSLFEIKYIGDAYLIENPKKLIMQEAFANIKDKENNDIPIGTFISIAEKYNKAINFDKKVITKVINHILINNIQHKISINLSLESIINTSFISWLKKTILEHKKISPQLVFSITAYAVAKDIDKFKFFADEIHKYGSKIIIKRFETKFIPLDNIKEFNLDFIRLARDYTNDISHDIAKQNFVESIQELANLLNIKVFAENIKNDEDLEIVEKYNLYGASR